MKQNSLRFTLCEKLSLRFRKIIELSEMLAESFDLSQIDKTAMHFLGLVVRLFESPPLA